MPPSPERAYLDVKNVTKGFPSAGGTVLVLRDVSVSFTRGTFTALTGPSGSGKSTLLALLGALDRPDSGVIRAGDLDLATADRAALERYRRSIVGIVFQQYNLLRSLSAVENVEATLQFAGMSARERRARAMECLDAVGIAECAKKLPHQLSGGQQQRVSIARAVARRPELLLADEPTGSLDREAGAGVLACLTALQRDLRMTTILVTHDHELAAAADVVVRMADGRIE
jgi:putative ABC transport system ATP-binding protein